MTFSVCHKVSEIIFVVTTWVNSSSKCTKTRLWPGLCSGLRLGLGAANATQTLYSAEGQTLPSTPVSLDAFDLSRKKTVLASFSSSS